MHDPTLDRKGMIELLLSSGQGLTDGRAPLYPSHWWAHFKFTPINIELTILPKRSRNCALLGHLSSSQPRFSLTKSPEAVLIA